MANRKYEASKILSGSPDEIRRGLKQLVKRRILVIISKKEAEERIDITVLQAGDDYYRFTKLGERKLNDWLPN